MITIFNIFIVAADQQLMFRQNIMNLFYLEFDLFRIYFTAFNEVEPLGTAKVEVVITYAYEMFQHEPAPVIDKASWDSRCQNVVC